MKDKKIREVMQNESFVKEISKMNKPEEVQAAFKNEGVDMSLDEIQTVGNMINVMATEKSTILLDEDLSRIAGGNRHLIYNSQYYSVGDNFVPSADADWPEPLNQTQINEIGADNFTVYMPESGPDVPNLDPSPQGWSTTKRVAVGSGAVALAGIAATVIGYGGYRAMNWAKRRKVRK